MSKSNDSCMEQEFKRLQAEGKQLAAAGKLRESIQKFELAKNICASEKVLKRIEKLKECLNESETFNQAKSQCMPNDESCKRSDKSSSNLVAFTGQKVLSDIQNVQKASIPRLCTTSTDLSPKSQSEFGLLKKLAKESAYDGKHEEALEYFKKALCICNCPKVKRYMLEIETVMASNPEKVSITEDVSIRREEEPSICKAAEIKTSNQSLEVDKPDLDNKLEKVQVLYEEARELAAEGKLTDALKVLKKAQSIHETNKVQKRIDKIEELISDNINDSGSNEMIKIAEDFSIFHDIYNKLYPYQREGVAWMWKLYKMGKGGILGDDMGLGKTFQVIAFMSGMIDAGLVKHVLIIMPVSLLRNWDKEFKKWCPGIMVHDFHSGSKKERERNLLRVQKRGHVLLTSYGMVVNNVASMTEMDGKQFVWDYLILDEGHKIKNPTKTTKAVYEIPSKNRLVLTGTPIQNNLKELWSLYDFVHQGTLLGSLKTFKLQYEIPITRAREKDATAGEKRLGTEMAENLKSLIKLYFLRRTKEEIWKIKSGDEDVEQLGSQIEKMTISKVNAKKNDLILWTYMSDPQIEIYNSFLHSDAVKSILVSKRSPLVELTTLKKICDHPRLLSKRACLQLGLDGDLQGEDLERQLEDESTMTSSIDNVTDDTLLLESGKLKLVIQLLENLKENGHRTLVFSLSRKILDMIHRILINRKWKVMRLDGTIAKTEERERRIHRFQNDSSYPVFLLTTQVGGVGITLTAADRVIIYDPSWNPATDAQAVDRVFRIGQERDVVVYRLITCGSVEEKIYRRQIFKDSITRQATGVADPYRYFSKQELRELFTLDNPHYSATQAQLSEMHSSQRLTDNLLERHIYYLQSLNIFGISDHDLMFSKNIEDQSEDCDKAAISEDYIKKQVAAAHELIKMEASLVAEGMRLACTYNRPYQEVVPLQKKSVKDTYKPPVLPEVIDLTENAVDVFPSPKHRKSLEPKSPDCVYKVQSPLRTYQESSLDIKQYSSPTQAKNNELFSVNELKKASISPLEMHKKSSPKFMIDMFKKKESMEPDILDVSYNIEKLRKSLSTALDVSSTDNLQNKSKSFMELDNEVLDLSLEPELPQSSVKSSRRSCARKSTLLISDSESSHRSSTESNLTSMDNVVEDSEDAASFVCDSSNSASVSFVPDSSPNTPATVKLKKETQFISETPPRVFSFEPESLSGNLSFEPGNSSIKNLDGSVRRITPLKVDKTQTPQNLSFAQAMATAVVLTPYNSPEKNENKLTLSVPSKSFMDCSLDKSHELSLHQDNSPIKFKRKKKPRQLCSDSEDSDNDVVNVTNLSLSSSEEHKRNNFENEKFYDCSDKDLENNSSDSESSTSDDDDNDAEVTHHFHESDGDYEHSNKSDEEIVQKDCENSSKSDEENGQRDSENSNTSEDESCSEYDAKVTHDFHESDSDYEHLNKSDEKIVERDCENSNKSEEENVQRDSENSNTSEDESCSEFESEPSDESGSLFSEDRDDSESED